MDELKSDPLAAPQDEMLQGGEGDEKGAQGEGSVEGKGGGGGDVQGWALSCFKGAGAKC